MLSGLPEFYDGNNQQIVYLENLRISVYSSGVL
jgi:hypothetical protein